MLYWVANVTIAWGRHRFIVRRTLAVLSAVSAVGKLFRLLHAGFTAVFVPMSCYLEHMTMGLLRLQASANEERAIEVAARNLGGSLANETWSG